MEYQYGEDKWTTNQSILRMHLTLQTTSRIPHGEQDTSRRFVLGATPGCLIGNNIALSTQDLTFFKAPG